MTVRIEVNPGCDNCGDYLDEKYPPASQAEATKRMYDGRWVFRSDWFTFWDERDFDITLRSVLCTECYRKGERLTR